jgi:hypothetical protein
MSFSACHSFRVGCGAKNSQRMRVRDGAKLKILFLKTTNQNPLFCTAKSKSKTSRKRNPKIK